MGTGSPSVKPRGSTMHESGTFVRFTPAGASWSRECRLIPYAPTEGTLRIEQQVENGEEEQGRPNAPRYRCPVEPSHAYSPSSIVEPEGVLAFDFAQTKERLPWCVAWMMTFQQPVTECMCGALQRPLPDD